MDNILLRADKKNLTTLRHNCEKTKTFYKDCLKDETILNFDIFFVLINH